MLSGGCGPIDELARPAVLRADALVDLLDGDGLPLRLHLPPGAPDSPQRPPKRDAFDVLLFALAGAAPNPGSLGSGVAWVGAERCPPDAAAAVLRHRVDFADLIDGATSRHSIQ